MLGEPEVVDSGASRETQRNIRAQNDVAEFLGSEGGYHVYSLGATDNNQLRTDWHDAIDYKGRGDPDIVILHRSDDGTLDGREFDIYSPNTTDVPKLVTRIKDKVRVRGSGDYRQADRIVLNLEFIQDGVDPAKLKSALEEADTYFLKEIIVVGKVNDMYKKFDIWTFKS